MLLVCSTLALFGFREPGCGGGSTERAGLNGPCTRAKDCDIGLRCFEGVCVPEDAGVADAAKDVSTVVVDASADATVDTSSDATDASGDL